jgi:Phosphoesterase family
MEVDKQQKERSMNTPIQPTRRRRRWVAAIIRHLALTTAVCEALVFVSLIGPKSAVAEEDLHKVKHIIIVMQENHSFDNYFGVLPYAAGGPYHPGPCKSEDHGCVDGLTCSSSSSGLACTNSNPDDDGICPGVSPASLPVYRIPGKTSTPLTTL